MSAALWMAWTLLPLTTGQTAEPYAAVVTERTEARCGPGSHYYATGRLRPGDRVEVYRREAGWLAVRPPRGSFSWVPARQMKTTAADDVAVAAEEKVRVWVGTSLAELNKHHWQVELRKGEPVELIGAKQLVTPAGDVADTWYKIAPPAGEFRWVAQAAVRRDDGVPQGTSEPGPFVPPSPQLSEPPQLERIGDEPLAAPAASRTPAAVKPAPRPEWLQWRAPADPAEFERLLEQFSTRLSAAVAQPIENWKLDELRIKAGKMAEQGPSPLQRGKARKLLANVEEFRRLAARMKGGGGAGAGPAGELPASGGNASGNASGNHASDNAGGFAGQGWLMPVHSSKSGVPPFVVVDDNGRFLQFVSPAPGVNLRRYEKTKVGVIGPDSYIPSLDMPHVTAQRVVKLR